MTFDEIEDCFPEGGYMDSDGNTVFSVQRRLDECNKLSP
jgi:hypothetical protein